MAKDYQLLGKIKKTLNKYIFVVLREPPRQSEAVKLDEALLVEKKMNSRSTLKGG